MTAASYGTIGAMVFLMPLWTAPCRISASFHDLAVQEQRQINRLGQALAASVLRPVGERRGR